MTVHHSCCITYRSTVAGPLHTRLLHHILLQASFDTTPLLGQRHVASALAPARTGRTHLLSNRATSFRTLPKGSDDRGKAVTHQTV